MSDVSEKVTNRWVDLEVTSYCNAVCMMCPRNLSRPEGLMEPEAFFPMADELIRCRTQTVDFCGYGEPLINKHIFDYVHYFTQHGIPTVLRTNGSLLTRDRVHRLLEAGIQAINVSVHGITKETYQRIMRGLRFGTVLENLDRIKQIIDGSKVKVIINAVEILPNAREVPLMPKFWRVHGFDNFELNPCHSRGGELTDSTIYSRERQKLWQGKCPIFPVVTYVAWNGDILACCQDAVRGTTKLGNLLKKSFEEILMSKREKHEQPVMFDLCQHCDMRINYDWLMQNS